MTESRGQFQQELRELEQRSLGALDLVLTALDRIIEALAHQDVELAQIVIDDDARIDAVFGDVHHTIISVLALQTPVAGDLRLLAALLHLVRFAERMGNQCVSVAKLIPLSGHEPPVRSEILSRVLKMGSFARAEVVQCRRSFVERNVPMAEDLVNRDREVNRLNPRMRRSSSAISAPLPSRVNTT